MKNNLKGLELVKELNSKRTQGEWVCQRNYIGVPSERVTHFDGTASNEQDAINAQYTALAVNTLHILAEALDNVKWYLENGEYESQMQGKPRGSQIAKIVEQALDNIKL